MKEQIEFFPLDFTYKMERNKTIIYIYGKYKNEKICVIYDKFAPYLLALAEEGKTEQLIKRLNKTNLQDNTILKTEKIIKEFNGKQTEFIKVYTEFPSEIPLLHKELKKDNIQTFEYDIRYISRFLIDNKIIPIQEYSIQGEFIPSSLKTRMFKAESIFPKSDKIPKLKTLALDIETYPISNNPEPILLISFYSKGFKKVLTWKKTKHLDYLEILPDEKAMLTRFSEIINEFSPDIICGYYSDGFDLPYIKKRADILNVKLDISENHSSIQLQKGRTSSAHLEGIIHIDVYKFIKYIWGAGLRTNLFDLDSVSKELLGKKKKEVKITELEQAWDNNEDLTKFIEYNLQDSKLAYQLYNKILPQIIELVKLTHLPMFDVSRARYSRIVEGYLLYSSVVDRRIIPKKPDFKKLKARRNFTYKGAFVFEPKPDYYEHIAIFDFSSLYPSILTSFNISPDTLNKDCNESNKVFVPGKQDTWFCKNIKGFIPKVMTELIIRRQRIKEMLKNNEDSIYLKARSHAMKTIANAMYGYLGFFAARWYCNQCADSITAFGRDFISKAIQKADNKGFEVIYGDTDSVFLNLKSEDTSKAFDFMNEVNLELPGMMELTFQGYYPRGIFVELKQGSQGAKKKYALIDDKNNIIIKGFETVRRNWSTLAKKVQRDVIEIILKEDDVRKALKYVQEVIHKIQKNKFKNENFIIRTQLTKSISSYESIGPHVAVAKKIIAKGEEVKPGDTISYIITSKPGSISDKAMPTDDISEGAYDKEYYIKNQIIPAVNTIFKTLGISEEEILSNKTQSTLSKFI